MGLIRVFRVCHRISREGMTKKVKDLGIKDIQANVWSFFRISLTFVFQIVFEII